jgi:hypothetical protein
MSDIFAHAKVKIACRMPLDGIWKQFFQAGEGRKPFLVVEFLRRKA